MNAAVTNWLSATLTVLSLLGLTGTTCTVTGCEGGLPLMAQANPQTKVGVDPLTKNISVFSSDGKTFTAKGLRYKSGETEFAVDELIVGDRSVENRDANVAQIKAGAEQLQVIMDGLSEITAELRRILNPASGVVDSIGDAAPKVGEGIDVARGDEATSQPAG